ncbi:sensor histidine kinase [Lusitaniella coriacea]|uniref:sensor histidine kinase n=1 Tax=Lusitaniella coriacea TaxID=1983105 RepID=UPI003CEE5DA5
MQGKRKLKTRKLPVNETTNGINATAIASSSLRRTLLWVEWTLIVIHVLVMVINTAGDLNDITIRHNAIALCVLMGRAVLSFYFPLNRPLWQRRAYIFLEIFVLLPAQAFTFWGLSLFLYLALTKSCFLLDRRDIMITAIATGIAWLGCDAWRLPGMIVWARENMPEYWENPQRAIVASLINNTGVYIAACTFVLLLSLTVVSERRSRQKALNLAKEVETLATALERTRIAREIHDSLGHSLTTLDVQLELAQRLYERDPHRAADALSAAKGLSSQSLADVRRSVSAMREEGFDLNGAMRMLIEQFPRDLALQIDLQTNFPQLPLQTSHQLYCIVREALTNVQKHSRATHITVRGSQTPNGVLLVISDNGIGFDLCATWEGFGLRGMQERVQILDGEIKVESMPGRGTRIEVKIPLKVVKGRTR